MSEDTQKLVTIGEQLIGSFNPDGRKDVEELKACAARMIDIVCSNPHYVGDTVFNHDHVVHEAKMQILSAQMMAVKSLFV